MTKKSQVTSTMTKMKSIYRHRDEQYLVRELLHRVPNLAEPVEAADERLLLKGYWWSPQKELPLAMRLTLSMLLETLPSVVYNLLGGPVQPLNYNHLMDKDRLTAALRRRLRHVVCAQTVLVVRQAPGDPRLERSH